MTVNPVEGMTEIQNPYEMCIVYSHKQFSRIIFQFGVLNTIGIDPGSDVGVTTLPSTPSCEATITLAGIEKSRSDFGGKTQGEEACT